MTIFEKTNEKKMKRIAALFFVLISIVAQGQSYKFAWISDTHIGAPKAEVELDSVVKAINTFKNISFTIISGDITEKGLNAEFDLAKSILDKLKSPYLIIRGNHDSKWSESGLSYFLDLWNEDSFVLEKGNDVFIGMNTSIPWKGGGGHFRPEDIFWLNEQLDEINPDKNIYLITHHPFNEETDNWFLVNNILQKKKFKAVLNGYSHKNEIYKFNNVNAAHGRSALSQHQKSWGFNIVERKKDLLEFYEVTRNLTPSLWGQINLNEKNEIPMIDSLQEKNYGVQVMWTRNLESTLIANSLIYKNKIYTADFSGIVTCFDFNGNVLWDYDTFGSVYSKPAARDGILAVATIRGDIITLDAETGEQKQSIGFDQSITSQLIAIDYQGAKETMMPKSTNSNAALIVGTNTGNLYCLDLETLQELWRSNDANGMIEVEPLFVNNKIIYGSWDSHIYCIDAREGWLIWKWRDKENFYYSPAACKPVTDGKSIFISTPEQIVYSIDLNLGKTLWKKEKYDTWESIGISNDKKKILLKGYEDKFRIIYASNGREIKSVKMDFGIDTMPTEPIEWKDKILFGAKDGNVYSIDNKYKSKQLLFLGTSRVHSVQHVKDNIFIASNMDGKVVLFKLK